MKLFKAILVVVIICISIKVSGQQANLNTYFPEQQKWAGWELRNSFKTYTGEELFSFIDGGADIVLEYGFDKTTTAIYSDGHETTIQADIYAMKSDSAAFGMYTFYLNGPGKKENFGNEGMLYDYYLVFWKSQYLIILSSSATDEHANKGLEQLAGIIDSKIPSGGKIPEFVSSLRKAIPDSSQFHYVAGPIGLSNVYKFIPGNAFKFKEGVSISFPGGKSILLKFKSREECSSAFQSAFELMQKTDVKTSYTKTHEGFEFSDYKKNKIACQPIRNYIFISIQSPGEVDNTIPELLKKLLE
jgi:hypothetical protein